MDEEKYNAKPGILGTERRTYYGRGTLRTFEGDREPIQYSYRVVHTQESIRVLDLRIIANAGVDLGHLQQLFRAVEGKLIVDAAIHELPE